jgi:hypothetical protein
LTTSCPATGGGDATLADEMARPVGASHFPFTSTV